MRYATILRVEFTIEKPWAVGAMTGFMADDSDAQTRNLQPVQRRPDGQAYLPATSLVGSLRQHLGAEARTWLGSEFGDDGQRTIPSALRVAGAQLLNAGAPVSKDHVAIDADRRASRGGQLSSRESVPGGTKVRWWLFLDREAVEKPDLFLARLLDRIATWQPIVGRHRTADQGWGTLTGLHHTTLDRRKPDDLTWWLNSRRTLVDDPYQSPPPEGWEEHKVNEQAAQPVLVWRFKAVDPLHLGNGVKLEIDGRKNVLATADAYAADSWRGVFRHRIAHILRVQGKDPEPVVDRLFGKGRQRGASRDGGFRGTLRFETSPVTGIPDEKPTLTQVGIDRISGGTVMNSLLHPEDSHGSLFTVQHLPVGVQLDLRIHGVTDDADEQLLDLVVADIHDQIIGIGGMTSRGFGSLELIEKRVENND